MADYFGNNTDGTSSSSNWGNLAFYNVTAYIAYTCPGSGSRNLTELGVRCSIASGSGNVRVAIYDADPDGAGSLIAQGSAEINVSSNTDAWYTHTSFVDGSGDPVSPALTGGVNYTLVVSGDTRALSWRYDSVTSGYARFSSTDYTGGFPDSISGWSNSSGKICVRAGVEAGGASPVPLFDYYFNNMRP
jgi:hypothetical protein